jgi:hypothetical protein
MECHFARRSWEMEENLGRFALSVKSFACHCVLKGVPKRRQASTFGAWAIFTVLHALPENATVSDSVAIACL